MPPKRKTKSKRSKQVASKPQVRSSNSELAQITKMLANLNKPQSQVTDLGRMLLKGGNFASNMLGFPKIFGSGSYAMENSCWNAQSQVPIMHSSNESVRIRHREYIADISMNGAAFNLTQYPVNPGISTTFPYLSAVANNFQEYAFSGLVFEFKTTSATALVSGTNTAMGSVMLAAQYRSDAGAFVNKTQLLNEMWSVDTVPSQNVVLPVECAPKETVLTKQYVRSGTVTGDIKFFDLCTLSVATFGGQSGQTNVVGELWVSYDVELAKPQLASIASGAAGASVAYAVGATWTTGNLFANTLLSVNSTIALTLSGNTVTFPIGASGYYVLTLAMTFAGTYANGALTYTNCHQPSNNPIVATFSTGTINGSTSGFVLLVTAPANTQASVTWASGIFPTGSGIISVFASSLPNNPALFGT